MRRAEQLFLQSNRWYAQAVPFDSAGPDIQIGEEGHTEMVRTSGASALSALVATGCCLNSFSQPKKWEWRWAELGCCLTHPNWNWGAAASKANPLSPASKFGDDMEMVWK